MSVLGTKLQKWTLLSSEDASPSPHYPIEKRTYKRPDGKIVEDFYVSTLADSSHIVAKTSKGKIIMIRMYKQGIDEVMIQFPAGRLESKHADAKDVAVQELEEEAGVRVSPETVEHLSTFALASTKATERVHVFSVGGVDINSEQKLDENEEIEVLELEPEQIDELISQGKIWDVIAIAIWHVYSKQKGTHA